MGSVDDHLARMFKVNGYFTTDARLYLPEAPVLMLGMAYQHAGFEDLDHLALRPKDRPCPIDYPISPP